MQDRREFLSKSLALGLGPIVAGSALRSAEAAAEPVPVQQTPAEFFGGFKREQIKTSGATINTVYGGKGSPLLLLHGIPETHVLWRKVAPLLAQDYFLVMPDLRGYGDSSKPPGGADHFGYSKRAMAQDQVEVMKHLGFDKFAVVGTTAVTRRSPDGSRPPGCANQARHSRHCAKPTRCISSITQEFATVFLPLVLLVQPPPFPKRLSPIAPNIF